MFVQNGAFQDPATPIRLWCSRHLQHNYTIQLLYNLMHALSPIPPITSWTADTAKKAPNAGPFP